ncbi:AbrB/MazE/SpoVT family DNA-binding domain-containing protein [Candidatus Shapirobacteria bacterium]|nr:AbrB/MazE/SpoVT family DNA-binding domain-containing protein [Candidatus Shapirobacteria bacterium]
MPDLRLMTITSQGQITIPADFRQYLGLGEKTKAVVEIEDDRLIIEPIPDLFSLEGSLRRKAKKGKEITKIIEEEEAAVAEAIAKNYR